MRKKTLIAFDILPVLFKRMFAATRFAALQEEHQVYQRVKSLPHDWSCNIAAGPATNCEFISKSKPPKHVTEKNSIAEQVLHGTDQEGIYQPFVSVCSRASSAEAVILSQMSMAFWAQKKNIFSREENHSSAMMSLVLIVF